MCLHTILSDPSDDDRMLVAISSAGVFASDDGGGSWEPSNRGLRSEFLADPDSEVGHCVHKLARHPSRPEVVFMQEHCDVNVLRDAMAIDTMEPCGVRDLPAVLSVEVQTLP